MTLFLTVLHVMVCVVLVVVVLLQHGKGADIGAVFGGGASSTVFGSRGAGNFLTRLTTAAALIFMVTSLSLSYLANTSARSLFEEETPPAGSAAPAAPPGQAAPTPEAGAPAPETKPGEAPGGFEEVPQPSAAKEGAPTGAGTGAAKAPATPGGAGAKTPTPEAPAP